MWAILALDVRKKFANFRECDHFFGQQVQIRHDSFLLLEYTDDAIQIAS